MICVAFCVVQQYWSEDEVGSVIDWARYVCSYSTYLLWRRQYGICMLCSDKLFQKVKIY